MHPQAFLHGSVRQPEVWLFFERDAVHAANGKLLSDWVKLAPSRYWNSAAGCWVITAFGRDKNPDAMLRKAGFHLVYDRPAPGHVRDESLDDVFSLLDLTPPLVRASATRPNMALCRTRFTGWEGTRDLLGPGAQWDKANGRFEVPLADVLLYGEPKPGLEVEPETVRAAQAVLMTTESFGHHLYDDATLSADLAFAASSTGLNFTGDNEEAISRLVEVVGDVPDWLGMTPYPYQRVGSMALSAGRTLLADPTGLGKGSPHWVRILTPTGWTTYGKVRVGDQVIGSDGRATTVTGVHRRGTLPVYRVTFSDNTNVVVDGDHLWTVGGIENSYGSDWGRTLSTRQIREELLTDTAARTQPRHFIPMVAPVEFADTGALPFDPYALGALLASRAASLVGARAGARAGTSRSFVDTPTDLLAEWDGTAAPRVPHQYLLAAPGARLEVLRGVADVCGSVQNGGLGSVTALTTTSAQLADDIQFLVESLGGTVRRSRERSGRAQAEPTPGHRVELTMPCDLNPFRLPEKARAWETQFKYAPRRSIRSIEPAGEEDVTCISVAAPDQLYVTENFIVTHNTIQIIAAFAIRNVQRGVIIVPPVVVSNWAREIEKCRLAVPAAKPPTKAELKRREREARRATKAAEKAMREAVAAAARQGASPVEAMRAAHAMAEAADLMREAAELTAQADPAAAAELRRMESQRIAARSQPRTDEALAPAEEPGTPSGETLAATADPLAPPSNAVASASATSVTDVTSVDPNNPGNRSLVVFRAGRKEPELPDRGIIIVPDSLLTSRPELAARIQAWGPDAMAYDEAHRARNWGSARSNAVRGLAASMPRSTLRISSTATPLFSNPAELAPLLAITGHLDWVFGGYDAYMQRYCKKNFFKQWVPREENLAELKAILTEKVWVRRKKEEVLTDLPEKRRVGLIVDVDLAGFRQAHNEVIDKITTWLRTFHAEKGELPDNDTIDSWARTQIGLISPLRKAAGVAKVPVALDMMAEWLAEEVTLQADGTFLCERPLLVWAHHQEVIEELRKAAPAHLKASHLPLVHVIDGSTPAMERGRLADEFQAGRIPILVCSITAAGVGITLTRASDAWFIESDWSVPNMTQAEDRIWRIGQKNSVLCTTLLAEGTLDGRIQSILDRKAQIIAQVMGDGQDAEMTLENVALDEGSAPALIISGLVAVAVEKLEKEGLLHAA